MLKMSDTAKYETWNALLKWVLVLCFLVAPRVVGHRHADVRESIGGSRILANHLARCHDSRENAVPDCQFHFHLSLGMLPGDIPAGTDSTQQLLSASDGSSTTPVVQCEASLLAYERTAPRLDHSFVLPMNHGRGLLNTSETRRIFFGVWQI